MGMHEFNTMPSLNLNRPSSEVPNTTGNPLVLSPSLSLNFDLHVKMGFLKLIDFLGDYGFLKRNFHSSTSNQSFRQSRPTQRRTCHSHSPTAFRANHISAAKSTQPTFGLFDEHAHCGRRSFCGFTATTSRSASTERPTTSDEFASIRRSIVAAAGTVHGAIPAAATAKPTRTKWGSAGSMAESMVEKSPSMART